MLIVSFGGSGSRLLAQRRFGKLPRRRIALGKKGRKARTAAFLFSFLFFLPPGGPDTRLGANLRSEVDGAITGNRPPGRYGDIAGTRKSAGRYLNAASTIAKLMGNGARCLWINEERTRWPPNLGDSVTATNDRASRSGVFATHWAGERPSMLSCLSDIIEGSVRCAHPDANPKRKLDFPFCSIFPSTDRGERGSAPGLAGRGPKPNGRAAAHVHQDRGRRRR